MNILAIIGHAKTANAFIENIRFDKCFLVLRNKQFAAAPFKDRKDIITYPIGSFMDGDYFDNVDWNEIKPLSKEIIEKMFKAEIETLHMYERQKKIKPEFYENRKEHYMQHLRFWNDFLDKHKIDVCFRNRPGHRGFDHIIYHLCKLKSIPMFMYYSLYPDYNFILSDIENPLQEVSTQYEELKIKYQNESIENIELKLPSNWQTLIDEHWNRKNLSYKPIAIPSAKRHKEPQKILKSKNKKVWEFYDKNCISPNYNEKYIYHALHFQPEASTSPLAGVFVNQLLIIEILSHLGIKIYVKEHPMLSENRSIDYYKNLLNMRNVNLIKRGEDSHKLLDNSLAVATATGTVGWEAVLRGKPVIMFGGNFYQYAPGVFKIGSVEEGQAALKEIEDFISIRKNISLFVISLLPHIFNNPKKDAKDGIIHLKRKIDDLRGESK